MCIRDRGQIGEVREGVAAVRQTAGDAFVRDGYAYHQFSNATVSYTHLDVYKRQVQSLRKAIDICTQMAYTVKVFCSNPIKWKV